LGTIRTTLTGSQLNWQLYMNRPSELKSFDVKSRDN